MAKPLISVIMPVYNAECYIAESIKSVLNQDTPNFELIIIDDCSIDQSNEIISSFDDCRIRLKANANNSGLSKCINIGLEHARGSFIARMDADDISHPQRFTKQLAVLNSNSEIGAVGTSFECIDSDGNHLRYVRRNHGPAMLDWISLVRTPILHPSVMIRAAVIEQFSLRFRTGLEPVEDLEFWHRFLRVSKGVNIPDCLLKYRVHPNSQSSTRRIEQHAKHLLVVGQNINYRWGQREFSPDLENFVRAFLDRQPLSLKECVRAFSSYLSMFWKYAQESRDASHLRLAFVGIHAIAFAFYVLGVKGGLRLLER